MSADSNPKVQVTRKFTASAERVFDAWLDPVRAPKFFFATETGQMVRAEIDARVGGWFNFTERRNGQDAEHVGQYLEIDRPRRLVFSFGVPAFSSHFDRVTIEIKPEGTGCVATLTHEMKPEFAEYKDRTQAGWTKMLEKLDQVLEQA